jgi:hypothetical protein
MPALPGSFPDCCSYLSAIVKARQLGHQILREKPQSNAMRQSKSNRGCRHMLWCPRWQDSLPGDWSQRESRSAGAQDQKRAIAMTAQYDRRVMSIFMKPLWNRGGIGSKL